MLYFPFKVKSIKSRLLLYSVLLFIFIIGVVSFSRQSEVRSLKRAYDFSMEYSTLDLFYSEVHHTDEAARAFLYIPSEQSFNLYSLHFEKASFLIDALLTMDGLQVHNWRLKLLQNMLFTYDDIFLLLSKNTPDSLDDYQVHYDFLVNTAQNILGTATQYYALLTGTMTESNTASLIAWEKQSLLYFIVIIIVVLAGIIFSIKSINLITKPIGQIVNNINLIKGGQFNFDEIKSVDREIQVLTDAFSDMAHEIDKHVLSIKQNSELKNELLKTENENLRISRLLTQTELKALQGQVNPHFFFNTLSMVSKMAYIENAYQTSEMMETVADLMRYSLDYSSRTSNLFGEIECLKNYLKIQRKRFGHRLNFAVSLAQDIPNIDMPGMILQPLVENAIVHGVGNMTSGATILINAYHDNRCVYLEVSDNGIGMEQDIVNAVLAREDVPPSHAETKGSGIGLQNVIKRLDMFFTGAQEILIRSECGCGTAIIITLPLSRGGECV